MPLPRRMATEYGNTKRYNWYMATVVARPRADGSSSYRVMFRTAGRQVGETFHSIEGAEQFVAMVERIGGQAAREVLAARNGRSFGPDAPPLLKDWLTAYIDSRTGITEGTRSDYRTYAKTSINPYLGELPVDAVTRDAVARWVNRLADTGIQGTGLSGKTIKNRHAFLSGAMSAAVQAGHRLDNPCHGMRLPRTDHNRREMAILTGVELVKLTAAMPDAYRPLLILLVGTGMRMGEATALQVGDVNLEVDPPTIRVVRAWKHTDGKGREIGPPKSRRGRRTIWLGDGTAREIRPLVEGRPADALVITNPHGQPVSQQTFHDVFKRALKAAGITRPVRVHDLRHTYASAMLDGGHNFFVVQNVLGHEDPHTTTGTYGHLQPGTGAAVAATMTQYLAPAVPEIEA